MTLLLGCKEKSSAEAAASSSSAAPSAAPGSATSAAATPSARPAPPPACTAAIVPVWHLEKKTGEQLYGRDRAALQSEPKMLSLATGFFLCDAGGDHLAPLYGCRAKGKAGKGSEFLSADEKCEGKGVGQGLLGYAAMIEAPGTKPILLVVNAKTGAHFYTPSPDAAALQRQNGYQDEPFVAAYVWMQPG
jgi:hypothetical protein